MIGMTTMNAENVVNVGSHTTRKSGISDVRNRLRHNLCNNTDNLFTAIRSKMETLDEMIAKREAEMERIWEIVKTWDYKTYRTAQRMFAPVEDEDEE
jgi:hypothetical protein